MAAETDIIRYMITGVEGEVIPRNATHVSVHPSVTVIPSRAFEDHPNIIELVCHDGVIKIESYAFSRCPRLKRVIMNGVKETLWGAFEYCIALMYIECDKLKIIGEESFLGCVSMTSFNLSSAWVVLREAYRGCQGLKYVKFGTDLEGFDKKVFSRCRDLERITIPLKNDLIQWDDTFQLCGKLNQVDFVEGAVLQETIDSLLCDEWRNEIVEEIDSINQILHNANDGHNDYDSDYSSAEDSDSDDDDDDDDENPGRKAQAIRNGIADVLCKIVNYKSQHRRLLKKAACRLQLSLPHDIVMNNVVPFLMLPQHTFDGEIERDDEELGMSSDDEEEDESHKSKLGDEEEENSNEGSVEDDIDEAMEEEAEDVTEDGERGR